MEKRPNSYQVREIRELDYINRQIDELYHAISLKIGLSDSACVVFYVMLETEGDCCQKDIANRYGISRQTINSTVKNLEADGYLTLTPGKGRDRNLVFTAKGKAFAEQYILPIFKIENNAFAAMTPEERSELVRLGNKYLSAFTQNVKQFLQDS